MALRYLLLTILSSYFSFISLLQKIPLNRVHFCCYLKLTPSFHTNLCDFFSNKNPVTPSMTTFLHPGVFVVIIGSCIAAASNKLFGVPSG